MNAKDRKLIIEPIHSKLKQTADKENCASHHLVVLFRNDRLQFRAVYVLEMPDQENLELERVQFTKISGQGPAKLSNSDVKSYYRSQVQTAFEI